MIQQRKDKLKKGEKVARNAVWIEGILVILKVLAGLLSGSLVLISDAIHSASDIISIITSWFGLKIAQRKASQKFPYGFYKAESLGALIISFLIIYASWEMLSQGYGRLFSFSQIRVPFLAIAISFIDALVLFFFGKYEIKIGKQIGAQSLTAMGQENKTHLFSSMAVLIGTLAAYYKIPYLEGLITIGIAVLILKIGLAALKNSAFSLMDVSPNELFVKRLEKVIKSVPGVEDFFDLRLRQSGPFVFGETKVGIRKFVDVKHAHEISEKIEKNIKKKIPEIDSFSIHVEPFKSDFHHLVIPVSNKKGLNSLLSKYFGRARYFLFINLKGEEIKGFYFLNNPYKDKSVRAGLSAAKMIVKQKSDVLLTAEIGEISFHVLKDNLLNIYQAKGEEVKEIIDQFINNKLSEISRATKKKS